MDNFSYFAMMYLNDWYWWDKPLSERILSADQSDSLSAFHMAAKYYKVTRNFSDDGKEKRLEAALNLVLKVDGPITDGNACSKVNSLATDFQKRYGKNAVSAASKFLWLVHKSPIVIFDSRAIAWLRENEYKIPYGSGYKEYRTQWLNAFSDHEKKIKAACSNLANVKEYSIAHEQSHEEVSFIANSLWFMERVFDKYLWFNAGD